MKKDIVIAKATVIAMIAMAVTMLLFVLMMPPVISVSGIGNEDATAPNEQVCGYPSMVDWIISGAIANETSMLKQELPINIAATGDFAGRIAFTSNMEGNNEIYVMNETNVTQLTFNASSDINPEWHPDGRKIAFSSNRDGDFEIYVMDADGTNITQLTNNTDGVEDGSQCWSPDGSKIAFSSDRDGNYEIYVMDADGTNVTRLTYNDTTQERTPHWSPDGSKIAFSSNRDIFWNIYMMNADGTNQEQLTSNNMNNIPGEWSPDGSKLLFFSDRDGDLDIYVMDADGTNVTQLTSTSDTVYHDFSPAWALGGEKIVFVSGRFVGDFEIYMMDADGTNLTRLTTNFANEYDPVWAPQECELPEICRQYDDNHNCIIERHEVINAVNDYFDGVITREQLLTVINATSL